MSDINGAEGQIGSIDPTTGSESVAEQPDAAGSLVNPFLKNVNPADRPVIEKYLKDWDANVTRRFQAIHAQYQPYKNLGELENIQSAMAVFNMLQSDPMQIYQLLQSELADEIAQQQSSSPYQQVPGQQQQQPGMNGPHEIWGDLPTAAVDRLGQMEQLLTAMAQQMISNNDQSKQAADDQQLEELMNALREKHGEFDEEYVLSKMFRGAQPEEAVQAYKQFVQATVSQFGNGRRIPQVLTGQGAGVPQSQKPQNSEERKAIFADMLANIPKD